MKTYRGSGRFLDLGTSWRRVVSSMSLLLPPPPQLGTHWVGGWVDPRVGLDNMGNLKFLILLGLEVRLLGRPASRHTDYATATHEYFNKRKEM
jgi:hypothetical protein